MSNNSSKKKPNYQKIDISDDTDNENDPLTTQQEDNTPTKPSNKKTKTFREWIFSNPFSKGPFVYFLVGIIASIGNAIFYLMDNDTAFIICGILGTSICFYGLKHFYTLLGLKAQIDKMGTLNVKFIKERRKLSFEVDRIKVANRELSDTHDRLMDINERNRENLDHFRTIQTNMDAFGKESIEEMTDLLGRSKAIESKWHDQLYEHERNMLHTVFERLERQGSRMGMNSDEFKEFENALPREYKQRFDRMGTFHHMSKGASLIQYDDFRCALDVFATMATENVDIEFAIQKTPRSKKKRSKSKQTKFRSMDILQEEKEESAFVFDSSANTQMQNASPNLSKLQEVESIDLEDISFDESQEDDEDNEDNAPALYDRKVVITKRTIRGSRFREDLSIAALMDDNNYGDGSDSDYDDDARMFGQAQTPATPGIRLEKRHFTVPGQSGTKSSQVQMKSGARKQFASLLDDADHNQ